MAEWCRAQGIPAKGHPLIWHETYPQWALALPDAETQQRLRDRIFDIVPRFKDLIHIWDVVNEATVSQRFDNGVGHWVARDGAAAVVEQALRWAHEANPNATLLYNDFNISPEFEQLLARLIAQQAPMHTIGIQSHMHKELWTLEKAWQVCETYAQFGLPLHFTELTVLSGGFKAQDDNDWHRPHTDWLTTAEGEAQQLAYAQQFYTLLFSHPAVEAITWWDFSDNGSWQGAPSGLVRKDMSTKPLYDWLLDSFRKRWTTDAQTTTNASGAVELRCFFGDYRAQCKLPSGEVLTGTFTLSRHGARELQVSLKG
jgi:GH35 family endo-1,4-beta-xylanase